ncbi:methyltransferase domain-containing protein [Micromonospora inaquosa]|uniref:methyltransferase domain-containing protein n=1 Tax=Micromonospora inaquosa TaxID=2203716 RepID=UPI001FC9293B|nr:methyltransferase domain-containing protein [Micromonospora inaquosa]
MTDVKASGPTAEELRARLADNLVAAGAITTPAVEAAVRATPREAFVPDNVDLVDAYADDVVVTKRGPDGRATSSVSAPWLQAQMIEQAALRPGARVLEIGSGGYNAALIAHVVGPTGAVTSIDIDADVTDRARTALARTGYHTVRVAHADGEDGYPASAPYDTIIVTAEAADIPTTWTSQLAPDGTLVVPLRIRGHTRSLALTRTGSTSPPPRPTSAASSPCKAPAPIPHADCTCTATTSS